MQLNYGTNRLFGIKATVRKFLFFKKTYFAYCDDSKGTPKEALKELLLKIPAEDVKKATYQNFIVSVEVYGFKDGKPICKYREPSWWFKWDYTTLMEKSKNW